MNTVIRMKPQDFTRFTRDTKEKSCDNLVLISWFTELNRG